jgi:F-type H+-transporting ATPase subunit a
MLPAGLLAAVLIAVGPSAGLGRAAEETAPPGKATAEKPAHKGKGEKKPSAMEHVLDSREWHFFENFDIEWHLPKIFGLKITKFMIMELIACGLILLIYIPLARRLRTGEPPRGAWENYNEGVLTFIREEIAKPSIGEHDADRFVPFLWTMFLFILFNNLLGIIPFGASPTASLSVTLALAVCVFFAIHGSAIAKMGFGHYLKSLWPHIDVPFGLGYVITPLVCVIEVFGTLVRNAVLAVRLFANMFAGHMVLATILIFIVTAKAVFPVWFSITVASVFGVVAMSLLEIFVAYLQAYIFVFLSALFIGMAMHPQH